MKRTFVSSLLLAAALGGVSSLSAQVVLLDNFSNFLSPQTLFFGDWSNTGDPFAGSATPAPSFSQNAGGFYNVAGVTNADSSFVERTLTGPVNLGSNNLLTLSLRLLATNTADSLTVFLLDTGAHTAFATFQTSDFNTLSFTSRSVAFTGDGSFNAGAVSAFRISGNDPFAGGNVNLSLDNLSATGGRPPLTAVPEPATYGWLGACALIVLAGGRHLRSRRG